VARKPAPPRSAEATVARTGQVQETHDTSPRRPPTADPAASRMVTYRRYDSAR
jgi:hypothetical protein